jgi:hypothetical protein
LKRKHTSKIVRTNKSFGTLGSKDIDETGAELNTQLLSDLLEGVGAAASVAR